jgi:Fe-S oxidoreductase
MFLKQLAAAVDAKVPSCPGCMTTLAESYEQLSTSSVIKLTKENGQ